MFERVAIVGVGLIGGSFGLALRAAGHCREVIGVGRSEANLRTALERGIIDAVETDVAKAAALADLVLVATPVAQFERVFREVAKGLRPGALLTDGGSTKRDVVAAARGALGPKIAQFVPAHPIAGAEKSGAAAASADLFRGKRVVIAALPENAAADVERVGGAWAACGANLARMTPDEHDGVFAAVSHFPHLLAFGLVADIAARENARQLFGYAASGFRDFTRIASSDPEMWRDICVANRDRLLDEVGSYRAMLARMEELLRRGDGVGLQALFAEARDARERWLKGEYR